MKMARIKWYILFAVIVICTVVIPNSYSRYAQTCNKTVTLNVAMPTYTVKFNSNRDDGNQDNVTTQSFTYGTAQNLTANTYTNGQKDFHGWNTERDGSGTSYDDEEQVNNLTAENGGEVVLYAQWGAAEYWVTYNFGNESFDGTKYLNTDIGLFNSTNLHRDFEISLDLSNFQYVANQDSNRNIFLCNQNESGTPYQGFAFQYRDNAMKIQVNCNSVGEVSNVWGKTSGNIVFSRTSDVLYQDGNLLYNFGNGINTFSAPLSFGANLDANLNPRRYSNVDLSNITIKMKYTYEEIQNIYQYLPSPEKTSKRCSGWYTASEGGTEVTNAAQLEAAGYVIYPHWINASSLSVRFNSNGGSGVMTAQGVEPHVAETLKPNTFTRSGYHFCGWSTTADGMNGTFYQDEDSITLNDNITLYAQWLADEVNQYTASSLTFNGTVDSIVDTGMYLFSSANIHRNFEIYFEIDRVQSNSNQATLLNSKDESGTPYPGFVYRVDHSKLMLKGDSTANDTNKDDRALNGVQIVRLVRINDVLYYSLNNEDYDVLMDYSNIVRSFDSPVSLGGVIKPNGARMRGFKGTLSNISIRYISNNATLQDYQDALPTPEPEPEP